MQSHSKAGKQLTFSSAHYLEPWDSEEYPGFAQETPRPFIKKRLSKNAPRVMVTGGSFMTSVYFILESLGAEIIPVEFAKDAEDWFERATHILIPGGADIHPAYYASKLTHSNGFNHGRDAIESALVDMALLEKKPLMGICRGHQMIAVMAGGKLHQDIAADAGIQHKKFKHNVFTETNSLVRKVVGSAKPYKVNSYHHQAVSVIPPGWKIAAWSEDGVVESIEHPGLPVISVQWHPEELCDAASYWLFRRFLAMKQGAAK